MCSWSATLGDVNAIQINTTFEILALSLAWHSVLMSFAEKPQGVSWAYIALSAVWALNCIPYYFGKGEHIAAACALGRAAANVVWCWRAAA